MSVSLRDYLAAGPGQGAPAVVSDAVPLEQVGALLSLTEAGGPLLLEKVTGYSFPVLGNLLTSRQDVARALGVSVHEISSALTASVDEPGRTHVVEDPPVQQVREVADLAQLPIPDFFTKETGPYLTAGVIAVQDVLTGQRNLSFARFKVIDGRYAMLGVSPNHHLGKMAQRAAEAGTSLPIAVVVGAHPAILLAACLYLGFGDDELECAAALLGGALDVARTSQGLLVPADAEVVLEGVVHPDERVEEGLVSEFHGRYHDYGAGYLTEFHTLTRRADAFFEVIVPGLHSEHLLLGAEAIAAGLRRHLRTVAPNVVEVAVPLPGAGRTAAVIAVRDLKPGQATELIEATFTAVRLIKQVVIVDASIDPWNTDAVEWARLSHVRAGRDLYQYPAARTDRSDPLAQPGSEPGLFTVDKIGIDATPAPGERAEGWDSAAFSAERLTAAQAVLAAHGIEERRSALVSGIADFHVGERGDRDAGG